MSIGVDFMLVNEDGMEEEPRAEGEEGSSEDGENDNKQEWEEEKEKKDEFSLDAFAWDMDPTPDFGRM